MKNSYNSLTSESSSAHLLIQWSVLKLFVLMSCNCCLNQLVSIMNSEVLSWQCWLYKAPSIQTWKDFGIITQLEKVCRRYLRIINIRVQKSSWNKIWTLKLWYNFYIWQIVLIFRGISDRFEGVKLIFRFRKKSNQVGSYMKF